MAYLKLRWYLPAAALAAAALAGCHDNNEGGNPSQPPTGSAVMWSAFVKQVYAYGPNTTPVNLDGLTFDFDVDNDPTAFDGLLM
jgi:hypothetical protein